MVLHGLVASAVIAFVFAVSPHAFAGDTDTARNYLSTIVSCLSTIFALCISITLVAIQLTASRYTHRVLDLFIKMPYNVSLTIVYFVTIIQSLFLLSRITEPIRETLPGYLQPQMNADMALVIVCFAMLVLYMYAVMQLLKPERIVGEIERECFVALRRGREADALERIEQICDIAKRAAVDLDSTTGMIAVRALERQARGGGARLGASVVRQFAEIAAIAAKEREGGMLGAVLASLYDIGERAAAAGRLGDCGDVLSALEQVARTALIGERLVHVVDEAVAAHFRLARLVWEDAAALRQEAREEEAAAFVERALAAVMAMGRDMLREESGGAAYVGRSILGGPSGSLLFALAAASGPAGEGADEAAARLPPAALRLLLGQLELAAEWIAGASPRDMAPFAEWLRRSANGGAPAARRLAALQGAVLAALARQAGRPDAERLFLWSIAECDWPARDLRALSGRREEFGRLFAHDDPAAHLRAVRCARRWTRQRRILYTRNRHQAGGGGKMCFKGIVKLGRIRGDTSSSGPYARRNTKRSPS